MELLILLCVFDLPVDYQVRIERGECYRLEYNTFGRSTQTEQMIGYNEEDQIIWYEVSYSKPFTTTNADKSKTVTFFRMGVFHVVTVQSGLIYKTRTYDDPEVEDRRTFGRHGRVPFWSMKR